MTGAERYFFISRSCPDAGTGSALCWSGPPHSARTVARDPLLRSRPVADRRRRLCRPVARQHARSRPPCRAAGASSRYWLAEHHNMPGIASAATAVVIAHVAGGTSTIRVGSGGIMLPNHSPLVIAEQFGTLASLLSRPHRSRPRPRAGHRPAHRPRAPPRRQRRRRALSRRRAGTAGAARPAAAGPAHPRRPRQPAPMCRCGSSAPACTAPSSPRMLGLPYAFASHFAPDALMPALSDLSRALPALGAAPTSPTPCRRCRWSPPTPTPRRGACSPPPSRPSPTCSATRADRCRRRSTTSRPTGRRPRRRAPTHMLTYAVVGSPETVRDGLQRFIELTAADELMIAGADLRPCRARCARSRSSPRR